MRGRLVAVAVALALALAGCVVSSPYSGPGVTPGIVYEPLTTCVGLTQTIAPRLGEPFHVDFVPQPLETVAPIYPPAAAEAGVEGVVVLDVLVCARGRLADVRVRRSIPMLDTSAIDCVGRWYWRAAELQGQPVAAWTEATVVFELPR